MLQYSNSVVMQTGTQAKEWDREPENKPSHIWSNDFDKLAKIIQWGKGNLFNKFCTEHWYLYAKE